MQVLLPQPAGSVQGECAEGAEPLRYPVLYLLHGWSDDETIWMRRTAIERYVEERKLVVIMPQGGLSYYQDMHSGMNYWTFLSEELPRLCRGWFPISVRREDTFAAGLSMGGYGAMRLGLAKPDAFAAVGSFSGAVDIRCLSRPQQGGERAAKNAAIFGSEGKIPETSDLFFLAREVAGQAIRPRIYQCCGTEDFLYQDNLCFRDHLRELGMEFCYEEEAGGHEWSYWDRKIERFLDWLQGGK